MVYGGTQKMAAHIRTAVGTIFSSGALDIRAKLAYNRPRKAAATGHSGRSSIRFIVEGNAALAVGRSGYFCFVILSIPRTTTAIRLRRSIISIALMLSPPFGGTTCRLSWLASVIPQVG